MEYRHEYKYLLDSCESAIIKTRIKSILPMDTHAGEDGKYLIKSLYFDSIDDMFFYENDAGVDCRNKYRIRYYDNNTSYISLEKKSKIHGMTRKKSALIDKSVCESLLNGVVPLIDSNMNENMVGILTDIKSLGLGPKVIVTYERTAFVYSVGNVRITFDENLASSMEVEDFLFPSECERPIFPAGTSLLEVKWDEVLPSFIRDQINIDSLAWGSFSKYYQSRKINNHGGI